MKRFQGFFCGFIVAFTCFLSNNTYSQKTNTPQYEKYQIYSEGKLVIDSVNEEAKTIFIGKAILLPIKALSRIDFNLNIKYEQFNQIADIGFKDRSICFRVSTHNKFLIEFNTKPFDGTVLANLSSPLVRFYDRMYSPLLEILYYAGYDSKVVKESKKIFLTWNSKRYEETHIGLPCFAR